MDLSLTQTNDLLDKFLSANEVDLKELWQNTAIRFIPK